MGQRDTSAPVEPSVHAAQLTNAAIRILVADDSEAMRQLLIRSFERDEFFDVIAEASDGEDALVKVAAMLPDAVVMDVSMAGMDGVEATRRIKALYPDVEVVGFSSDDWRRADMKKAGASEFVLKAQPVAELARTIRNVVTTRRASTRQRR